MRSKKGIAMMLAMVSTCSLLLFSGCQGSKDKETTATTNPKKTEAVATPKATATAKATATPEATTPAASAEAKGTYKAGTLTQADYKSEYIGIEFKANDKYHLATQEQMKKAFGAGAKIAYGDKGEAMTELAKNVLTYEMMATTSSGSPNVNIAVQGSLVAGMKEKDYLDAMKQQLESVKTMTVKLGDPKEEEFCGAKYLAAPADVTMGTAQMTEKIYIRKKDDNFIIMTVTVQKGAEKEADALLANFKQVK